jgi:hypothetical protein
MLASVWLRNVFILDPDQDLIFLQILDPDLDPDPTLLPKHSGSGSGLKHSLLHNANHFKGLYMTF